MKNGTSHIAHVVWSFDIGGTENGIVNLINHHNSRFKSSVIALTTLGLSKDRVFKDGAGFYQMESRGGNDVRVIFRLAKLLRELKPDILHSRGWGTYFESAMAAKLSGVPLLVHGEHGTTYFDRRRRLWAYRWLRHVTSHYTVVSKNLGDMLQQKIGIDSGKISYLPNGVDTEKFKPQPERRNEARKELGLGPKDFVVGSVGRLVEVKGFDVLIGALKRARQYHKTVRGIIIGDGPERGKLERLVNADGRDKAVLLPGNRDNVHDLLPAFDVFVCSSHSEGTSNTILEAMASGLPVIATRVGGNPELIQESKNGKLVSANNFTEIASAIIDLKENDKMRSRLSKINFEHCKEKRSIKAMVGSYEELYCRLISMN